MIENIEQAWKSYIEEEQPHTSNLTPRTYIYASARRRCLRRMTLECQQPSAFEVHDPEVRAKFLRGHQRELDLRRALSRVGQLSNPHFQFVGEQKRIEIHTQEKLLISGKIDGFITWDHQQWPVEIKSWDRNLTNNIQSFEDLYKSPWTWPGAHQLLAYLYAESLPHGLLVLDRPGIPKFIQVDLETNYQAMEDFLKDAETVRQAVETNQLPDYTAYREECQRCPVYQSICNPPIAPRGKEPLVFSDPNLEALLEERESLKVAGERYKALDEDLKKTFRGVENGFCGPFQIQGKWGKMTRYEIPELIKSQYAATDEQGKFTLKIFKVSPKP